MSKPKALVFSGYGLNCEEETKYGFDLAGVSADIVHINDLVDAPARFKKYQILAFPGGFAYGDDTGSGNAYAQKVKNHLWDALLAFIKRDTLIIGICNGFQILVNLGILPAFNKKYGERQVALLHNASARYTNRWIDMEVCNDSPWLKNIKKISMPVAHGEGKFYAPSNILSRLKKKKMIALTYIKGETSTYLNLPANPNGSLEDIAGITDETGRILGLMPHPDRALFFTQLPNFPLLKEKYSRGGKKLPFAGPGLSIFKNAVRYFS